MLIKGLLFSVFFFYSCAEQVTPFQVLQEEIKEVSKNIQYKNIKVNNLSIQLPDNLDSEIQNYIQDFIKKDLETEYCSNEESKVEIKYEITFSTDKFFSIKKETRTMFCYPYDNIYNDFINLLLFEKHLYKVSIKESDKIKQMINNYINSESVDIDCEYSDGNYQLDLTIDKNRAYIFLQKDKVCFLKIPINIEEDNFNIELL